MSIDKTEDILLEKILNAECKESLNKLANLYNIDLGTLKVFVNECSSNFKEFNAFKACLKSKMLGLLNLEMNALKNEMKELKAKVQDLEQQMKNVLNTSKTNKPEKP